MSSDMRDEGQQPATKADLQSFATKADLQAYATKADIKAEFAAFRVELRDMFSSIPIDVHTIEPSGVSP